MKAVSFERNCGVASLEEYNEIIQFNSIQFQFNFIC